jgi:sugar-specific transcriptional regulator TrmB
MVTQDKSENINQILLELGLTDKEIRTYITFLQLGSATPTELSKKNGIPRTTTHDHLSKLLNLGLVKKGYRKGKNIYLAESPSILLDHAKRRLQKTEAAVENLFDIFQNNQTDSKIAFYKHKEGIKRMHEESLSDNIGLKTYLLGNITSIQRSYRKNIDPYIVERVKKGIHNYIITPVNTQNTSQRYNRETNSQELRKIKYIDSLKSLPSGLFNYDNTTWITSLPESGFVIKITDKDFSETFRNLFDSLWKSTQDTDS